MVKGYKIEKIWVVGYYQIRRHSRVLYLPLDSTVVKLHDLRKGDIVKAMLVEVRRGPRDEEGGREAE